jgi:hypothetical protein
LIASREAALEGHTKRLPPSILFKAREDQYTETLSKSWSDTFMFEIYFIYIGSVICKGNGKKERMVTMSSRARVPKARRTETLSRF